MVSATSGISIQPTSETPYCGLPRHLPPGRCLKAGSGRIGCKCRRRGSGGAGVRGKILARQRSLVAQHLAMGQPLVRSAGNLAPRYLAAKRLWDIAGSLGLLVLFAPVMLAIFLVLRGDDPRPAAVRTAAGRLPGPPLPALQVPHHVASTPSS